MQYTAADLASFSKRGMLRFSMVKPTFLRCGNRTQKTLVLCTQVSPFFDLWPESERSECSIPQRILHRFRNAECYVSPCVNLLFCVAEIAFRKRLSCALKSVPFSTYGPKVSDLSAVYPSGFCTVFEMQNVKFSHGQTCFSVLRKSRSENVCPVHSSS